MYSEQPFINSHSTNLLFMRRKHAVEMMLTLADSQHNKSVIRNLLLNKLHNLPTSCFIGDDWYAILEQILHELLTEKSARESMPDDILQLLFILHRRLSLKPH